MKKILIFAAFSFSMFSFSQEISQQKIKEVLSTLASDKMNGREIGTPENDSAAVYIAQLFKESNLDFCTGDSYLIPFNYEGKTVYNVCGIKKGKSDKFLGFSAHFDHIGTNQSKDDHIYNGADDNASGTTAVIELAEYFKNKNPEFSLIFMGFNGEEKGMKGSKALADNEKLNPIYEKMTALFNLEMIATKSAFGENALFMTGDDLSDLDELINGKAVSEFKIFPDPYKSQQLFYRSDNVSFLSKNIIAHSFSTVDMTKAHHYHQVNDDLEMVDFENLTKIINNLAKTVENLTQKNFAPKYNDKVKFN